MSLLLDAGALIAYERTDSKILGHVKVAREGAVPIKTSTAVVAQVWRHASKQVALARFLRGVEEIALTAQRARDVGILLALARRSDVVDAALVEIAVHGDEILTSDPADIAHLATASGKTLIVTRLG
jgi:hypothetical protein